MAILSINLEKLVTADDKFEQRKQAKIAAVMAFGETVIQSGYPYDFGGEHGIQHLQLRNNDDKINWQTVLAGSTIAVSQGAALVPGPNIRTAENNVIQITYGEAVQMLTSLISWAESKYMVSWAKKDAIRATINDTQLDAVAVEDGWE